MTYKQALNFDQKWTEEQAKNDLERYLLRDEPPAYKAVALGMSALEKRIPKMVTHEASLVECCTCPSCRNVVDEFTEFVPGQRVRVCSNWCRYCGQALKWED